MEVIAIPGGNSIAYSNYLGDILEKLSPQGLPPFGSLLLAIIATNPNGGTSIDHVYSLVSSRLKTTDDVTLAKAIAFLKLLSEVPNEYKQSQKRILLLQALFERSHNGASSKRSVSICAAYKNRNFENTSPKSGFSTATYNDDFKAISLLSARFDTVQAIIDSIAGLPDPKQYELEFQEEPNEHGSPGIDLIDELINNSKTFTTGSLVRWLWGGLNIPVHSVLPSQQPLGGISDLTNKGDYDKLLISEFAHDDLTFLSRLANQEALYVQRETPPSHNDLQRIILIDASLKNWGSPKAIAFAIMLAIARHPKTDIPCLAFVLGTDNYVPVSIENIDTIIDALQIFGVSLHAAKSLTAFFKDYPDNKNQEVFFITESSTPKNGSLSKVLNEYNNSIHYLVLTDEEGNVDVFKKHQHSKRHLQHIKLPLDNLWKTNRRNKEDEIREDLATSYPILFRTPGNSKSVVSAPDGEIFMLSGERTLLRFFNKSAERHTKGWDLVYESLPFTTSIFEIGLSGEGHHIALLFNTAVRQILLLNLSTREKKIVAFDQWKSTSWTSFIFEAGKFLHTNSRGSWSIDVIGNVAIEANVNSNKFTQRDKELADLVQKYSYSPPVFKNIQRVFINGAGELVFNIHTLRVNVQHSHIKLVPAKNLESKISASKKDNNEFKFSNGSSVQVNRNGMFILKSVSKDHPEIYIPTSLDASLGVSTVDEFSGNEYYLKESMCEVIIIAPGSSKFNVIKAIKDLTQLSLADCKGSVDNSPSSLKGMYTPDQAHKIKASLETLGATIEIKTLDGRKDVARKLDLADFYKKHIDTFISTIQNYGS